MSRREIIAGYKMAAAQSLAANFTAASTVVLKTVDNVCINIATSGVTANTGFFYVQHRIHKNKDVGNQSAWATLTLSSVPTLNNADSVFAVFLNQIPPGEIQVGFTVGGGSPNGSADIWLSANSVGA